MFAPRPVLAAFELSINTRTEVGAPVSINHIILLFLDVLCLVVVVLNLQNQLLDHFALLDASLHECVG